MVLVVKRWEDFLSHADESTGIGLYQVIPTGRGVRLRARQGTLGYEEDFTSEDDPGLKDKTKILDAKGMIYVVKVVGDESWFI
jgi:hypothetical protein